jgi:DNA-binding response OmpR family regulator
MPVTETSRPTILLVGDDEALSYLIERYGEQSGFRVRVERTPPKASDRAWREPAVVWLSSIDVLAAARPRETGLISDDAPLVVCSSVADDRRARELGADYSVLHPLTYPDFLAALSAVGLRSGDASRP